MPPFVKCNTARAFNNIDKVLQCCTVKTGKDINAVPEEK